MAEQPIAISLPVRITSNIRSTRPAVRWRFSWQLLPLAIVLAVVLFGPYLIASPTSQSLSDRLQPPLGFGGSSLGTDGLGRDVWARIVVGAGTSLQISVIAATGAAVLGIIAGIASGLIGGWLDRIITLLVDTVLAVPFITVGLMVTATMGQSTTSLILLLIGTGWITHARVLRSQARVTTHADFVRASHAMGAGRAHIARHHVLPNLFPIAIVVYFQQIGSMLLWSASLTWLGIGLPIDRISLGGIVRDGQELLYNGWWVSVSGGLAIVFIVTSLNLGADWLRAALDPTLKGHTAQ